MVDIRYSASYGKGLEITATGHATGSEIYCAMISALLGAWSAVCDENNGEAHEESGNYRGWCRDGVERYAAFRCVLAGLRRVQEIGEGYLCIHDTPI